MVECLWFDLEFGFTCTNTDARLERSQRNSAAFSCDGFVWGSVMPTDKGISVTNTSRTVKSPSPEPLCSFDTIHLKNQKD